RDDSLAVLFGRVHGRYAQALNIRLGRCGHLWQARFHSCPMEGSHLWMGIRYVEENPCQAGIVQEPAAYRWSSAAAHLLGDRDKNGILDMKFAKEAGGVETWRELHGTPMAAADLIALRKCTYAGRPFGSERFVEEMEVRFQRKWLRKAANLAKSA